MRFRQLLISSLARSEIHGAIQLEKFKRQGAPIRELPDDKTTLAHPDAKKTGTLIILRSPPMGWITVADHGILANRAGERYLNPIVGCMSACTYCYLRGLESGLRPLRLHVGVGDLLNAIDLDIASASPAEPRLFCTGELADSLGDADIFPIGSILATHFGRRRKGRLELRTKSESVDELLRVEHNGHTTVAFSITPQIYIDQHEPGTSGLEARLRAARACQDAGYPIAFKMEPIIIAGDWKTHYGEMLQIIRRSLDVRRIDHISVGCLRWSQRLAKVPTFAKQYSSEIATGEWIQYRVDRVNGSLTRDSRVSIYRWMRNSLRQNGFEAPIWWSLEEPDLLAQLRRADAGRPTEQAKEYSYDLKARAVEGGS